MTDETEALRTWLQLLTASNGIKKTIDTALRSEFGLSISRFDILSALDRAGSDGLKGGELAERLIVTNGNVTLVTAPLIEDGYVKRTPLPSDKRVAIFKLTKKGQKVFAKMAEEHRHWVAEAFADLSDKQLATLRRALEKINVPSVPANQERNAA